MAATKTSDWRPGATVCRCCFAEGCYKDISTEYFWMGKREVYAEMLSETFDVTIAYPTQTSSVNSTSRLICEPCISRLRDASDFKRQVQECEKTFLQHLDPGRTVEVEIQIEPEQEKPQTSQVKVKQEMSDDDFDTAFPDAGDDDDDLDDQPLTRLRTKSPKKESVDLLDLLDNAKPEKRKATAKPKAAPAAKKPKKKEVKPSASKIVVKPEKKKDIDDDEALAVKQNANLILTHSTAYPFYQGRDNIRCPICSERFVDPALFRAHMDTNHLNDDKFAYIKPFDQYLTRVDITNLRCKICSKLFTSLESIAEHLVEEHELEIDLRHNLGLVALKLDEDAECLVCSQRFLDLFQLYRHMGTHCYNFVCEICGKNYETARGLKLHIKIHDVKKKYSCERCKKQFLSSKARKDHILKNKSCMPIGCRYCNERFLNSHKRDVHYTEIHGKPKMVFQCSKCDKKFDYRSCLVSHFKVAHTELYKCEYCEKTLPTAFRLQEHVRHHTKEKPYKCSTCEATFTSEVNLKRHSQNHDDSRKLHCPFCIKKFDRIDRLKEHFQKSHPYHQDLEDIDDDDGLAVVKRNTNLILTHSTAYPFYQGRDNIRCPICSERFVDPALFRAHMDTNHLNDEKSAYIKPFDQYLIRVDITNLHCKICSKLFTSLESIAEHLVEEHELEIDLRHDLGLLPLKLDEDLECLVCSERFLGLFQLYRHTGTHYSNFICDICGKNYETAKSLKNHIKIHDVKKKYSCERCKKQFLSSKARKDHLLKNKSCMPIGCRYCNERFVNSYKRDVHYTEIHGKPKMMFQCSKCDQKFDYRVSLCDHFKVVHTELNKCKYCETTFSTASRLQEHINRHHTKEKPYKCSTCEATFYSEVTLKRHSQLHDDSRKLHCPFCIKKFSRRYRLKEHVQKSHPNHQNLEDINS